MLLGAYLARHSARPLWWVTLEGTVACMHRKSQGEISIFYNEKLTGVPDGLGFGQIP